MKSLIKRNKHYETFFFQVANFGYIYITEVSHPLKECDKMKN